MRNWGVIILLLFFINHQKTYSQVNAQNGFIKAEGLHFTLNGNPLYASGFNAYWLMDAASDPTQRGNVSFAFQEAAEYGLTMARAWAFRDGGYSPLQYSPGSEFGKSSKDYGYTTEQRNEQFHRIYSAIYSSAAGRGAAGGGLFWQLLNPGMDNLRDGYEIVLSENPTTANLIADHSHRLNGLKEMQARPINLP